jgi:hypothetical protein
MRHDGALGGADARPGARKEKALPQAGWAMWASQAGWPAGLTRPKARKEFLLEIK